MFAETVVLDGGLVGILVVVLLVLAAVWLVRHI